MVITVEEEAGAPDGSPKTLNAHLRAHHRHRYCNHLKHRYCHRTILLMVRFDTGALVELLAEALFPAHHAGTCSRHFCSESCAKPDPDAGLPLAEASTTASLMQEWFWHGPPPLAL